MYRQLLLHTIIYIKAQMLVLRCAYVRKMCEFLVKASQNISISWPVSNAPDSSSRIFTKWHSREPMKSLQFASSDDVSPSVRLQISISQRATLSQWAPSNELLSGQWRGSTTGKRWRLIYRRAAHEWQSRQTEHTRNTEERNIAFSTRPWDYCLILRYQVRVYV